MHAAIASRLASLLAVAAARTDASTTAARSMPDDSGRARSVNRQDFGVLQVATDHGARVEVVLARLVAQLVEVDPALLVARECVAAAVPGKAAVAKLEA